MSALIAARLLMSCILLSELLRDHKPSEQLNHELGYFSLTIVAAN
jgi:hypothetical protein